MHLQIDKIIEELDCIGTKKSVDIQHLKDEFAAKGQSLTTHDKGQNTGIYSYETRDKVREKGYIFADYCRAHYKGAARDIGKFTPEMVTSFLRDLAKLNYAENTYKTYTTAIEKIGSRLEVGDSWNKAIQDFAKSQDYQGIVKKDIDHRAYDGQAGKIIDAITNDKAKLAAEVIRETGIRRNEACHFSLNGNILTANGKTGKEVTKIISDDLKHKIESSPAFKDGRFDMSKSTLSHNWTRACERVGIPSNGVHGMRHDIAQETMKSSLASGKSVTQSLKDASQELNHKRAGITWTYQR